MQRTWILTHFHADHYLGLSKSFKQGRILCTPITAALIKLKLRVPEQCIVPLELGKEVIVEGRRADLGACCPPWACTGTVKLPQSVVTTEGPPVTHQVCPAENNNASLVVASAGTRVHFIDANHCPGAAMVVAYPPGGLPPILHTGDARLTAQATQQQPALQALVGKAVVVLDTTYANPTYCFPPQQDVLDWVLRAVKV